MSVCFIIYETHDVSAEVTPGAVLFIYFFIY